MAEKKVEHVSGGSEIREFSAIKGQGKTSRGPSMTTGHEDKPAIAKLQIKKEGE